MIARIECFMLINFLCNLNFKTKKMKKKITLLIASALFAIGRLASQSSCSDLNGYVNFKNVGSTGSYSLHIGGEEYAGQTYFYSVPGKVSSVRVHGNYSGFFGGVPLKVSVCNVDISGRPTTTIQSVNAIWWYFDNAAGFINVFFPSGGVNVSNNFAVTVQVLNAFPFGNSFNLEYTGNGEGLGQDLASLAGTSTGFNWSSAKNNFGKDGDFYLVPRMTHFISSNYAVSSVCNNVGTVVSFTNTSIMTKDSLFNRIALSTYTGTSKFYTWNFGDGSPISNSINTTHTYTLPGVYTVSLTSTIDGWNNLCSNTYTSKISVGLSVAATAISSVSCNGGSNGSLTAVGSGGAPTYSYSLNGTNYQTASAFTNLTAGIKTLYIKDILGCSKTTTFTISQPSAIVFTTVATTNASCGGSDGSLLAGVNGGVGSIQYKLNNNAYQSNGSFNNLPIGIYTITAKDANGCTSSTVTVVNDFGGPVITNINPTQVSCNGGSDGSITITSNGGIGTILYSINGGITFQSGNVFTNVQAGTYGVMVKDAANCSDLVTIVINQPSKLMVSATTQPANCNGSPDGEVNVNFSTGGIGLHNYSLNGINYQSGLNFYGLSAGVYTVYVKDVASCISQNTVTVLEPTAVSALINVTPANCYGAYTGIISVAGIGGNGNYIYSINGVTHYQPIGLFTDLAAGNYAITIKDGKNCLYTTTVSLSQPNAITTTVSTTNSTCGNTNGGILVLAGGGAGGFQYSLNGIVFGTNNVFNPLTSGTYFVVVKDATSCQVIVQANIVDSNGPVINNESHTNVSCHGGSNGSITITNVSGGTGTLQYSINGFIWQNSPVFNNLTAGNYNVTVKDANGCTGTINVSLTQPNPFIITTAVTNVPCYGNATGSATITASGGAGVLAYSNNEGLSYQASNVFTGLFAGTYAVLVKDAANCGATKSFTITQAPAINMSLGVLNVTCYGANNGAIIIGASGGTGSLLYGIAGNNYTPSNVFSNLAGNLTYFVSVKDANNCVKTLPAFISEPLPIIVTANQVNVFCAGGNNGAINLTVSGGVFPYNFQWSNGDNSQGLFNLSANTYSVNVIDFNGCSSAHTYNITQPTSPLIVNSAISNATSGSANDGSVDITVTGGVGPYTYNWSNGATTEDISGLTPGAYLVTITDNNGCTTSSTYIVGNVLGISGNQILSSEVMLYPNPSKDNATIEAKGYNIDKLEVLNLLGQKIFESSPKTSMVDINTAAFKPGSYFVRIYINNKLVTKRLTVVN